MAPYKPKTFLAALLFASAACLSPFSITLADDAQLIVEEATNLPFHPGDQIPADKTMKLDAGQSISLIAQDGRVISLKGPYAGPPAPQIQTQAANIGQMLLPLVQQAGNETATPGVIRDGTIVAGPRTDPWVIDASQSGDVCVHEAVAYDLWRPDGSAAATLKIAPTTGGTPVNIDFPIGQTRTALPDSLSFTDGAQYSITGPGSTATVTIHTVPKGIDAQSKITAAWFLQKNCKVQANALLQQLNNG